MKKLMLMAAMAACVHGYAQRYAPVGGICGTDYGWPCPLLGGTANGYSHSDASPGTFYINDGYTRDVHGTYSGSNEHYAAGYYTTTSPTSYNSWIMRRNATTGQPIELITFDASTYFALTPTLQADGIDHLTVDEANKHLYATGTIVDNVTYTAGFIRCFDVTSTTSSAVWDDIYPGEEVSDVLVDAFGDVYVLLNTYGSGGFTVRKYSSSGSVLGTFSSTTLTLLTSPSAFALELDNVTGDIYICGSDANTTAFVCGMYTGLTLINYNTDMNSTSYNDIDIDNSGNLFAVGNNSSNNITWATWSIPSTTYSISSSGTSSSTGLIHKILIDPNNRYAVLADGPSGRYLTYIDFSGPNDIHYGTSALLLSNGLTFDMHHDEDGNILLAGTEYISTSPVISTQYVAKFNYSGGPISWGDYENKPTTIATSPTTEGFSIYPNPATNSLTVKNSGNKICTYRIMNTVGQVVEAAALTSNNDINIRELKAGNYYLQLSADGKPIGTQMFVKQ